MFEQYYHWGCIASDWWEMSFRVPLDGVVATHLANRVNFYMTLRTTPVERELSSVIGVWCQDV